MFSLRLTQTESLSMYEIKMLFEILPIANSFGKSLIFQTRITFRKQAEV